jgi:putative (di)nucleoside polyphosphate hydrolase
VHFLEKFPSTGISSLLTMIDSDGFRANVGIMLCNEDGKLFWARRAGMDAWQFPQGGIKPNEDAETAMYRELREEIGLLPEHVEVIASTDDWLKYWLPRRFIRQNILPLCIGQKQIWFLLKLIADESFVRLDMSDNPEFDTWRWIDYWDPAQQVVAFKRHVYEEALKQLAPYIFPKFS